MSGAARSQDVAAATHPVDEWPYNGVDVADLRIRGWQPTPFREFILKVHQRCNLACEYCYVYTMADQSWRARPPVMPAGIVEAVASRIAEHASTYQLSQVQIVLHGGEPLLAGRERLHHLVSTLRAAMPAGCDVALGMQTNGVLLDAAILSFLREHSIAVGISLDGIGTDHDTYRRGPDGRGSYATVRRALKLFGAAENRSIFAGLLCTINPVSDPIGCYEELLAYRPPAIDFLFPHANWSSAARSTATIRTTPHGDWLVAAFERWYRAPRQETRVRLFEDIISLVLGGASRSEQVGLSPVGMLVIETDGGLEQVDSLKSTYAGACGTGLNVVDDRLDAALDNPGIAARQLGLAALSDECLRCPVHRICGAGHYAHRYRAGVGFRNPSVYCADLRCLIDHIRARVSEDIAQRVTPSRR